MNKIYRLVAMIVILVGSVAGNAHAGTLNNVVIISIDALHPDALMRAKLPTISNLMRTGAYTLDGHSTEPPLTLIAHTTMFTGLTPQQNGKTDNNWHPGEATVQKATIFNTARSYGYKTGYFYSKEKLGYLVNGAIDDHRWFRDNALDLAENFIKTTGHHFIFLHISGLDEVGPEYGWLSTEYLEEFSFIDEFFSSLIESIVSEKHYLIMITSDHAGHDRIHGSRHAEDYRLPFVVCSDSVPVKKFQNRPFSMLDVKKILDDLLRSASR